MLVYFIAFFAFVLSALGSELPPANYGKAAVILSIGRGGSTWFCDVVKRTSLANSARLDIELLGNNPNDMKKVTNPTKKVIEFLNKERRQHPKGLVGFKMKPYVDNEAYDTLYRHYAANNVSVLLLTRNPLDREISHDKHSEANVEAHCLKSDIKCIEKHKAVKVTVPIAGLIETLNKAVDGMESLHVKLRSLNVQYLHVSYDTLAFGCKDQKLKIMQQISDFVYPQKHKTADLSPLQSKYEYTSDRNQSNVAANFAEIAAALKGTKHEKLLRTADPPCPNDRR